MNTDYDVLIVGARCAGAATGLLLARAGCRVLMVDRAPGIGDTLSTHALMRGGVAMLDRLGVLGAIMEAGTPAVTRTRFIYGPEVVDIAVKAPGLCAPRRYLLDRVLCEAAVAAGVELSLGTGFVGVLRNAGGRVTGAELRMPDGSRKQVSAGLVIGADGRASPVAAAVKAAVLARDDARAATVYGYFDAIPDEGYRWYFDEGVQAGVIPTTGGQHCVFSACRPSAFRARVGDDPLGAIARSIARWEPEVAASLQATGPVGHLHRYPGAPGHIRDCAGPGWALVGDAGFYKDPATAHGITDALLDAGRLAAAWVATPGSLDAYRAARAAHAAGLFRVTQRIASFDWDFAELKALHAGLNTLMKAEVTELAAGASSPARAA